VILVSKYDQLQLEPKLQARIKLVENAIEYPVKRRNEMNCNNKVVYMGRISCEKGILDFVRKNQLTGFELNIYGPLELSFEDEQDFLSIIDNNENFIFHGNVSFSEVRNILSQYEFFLNPSRRESLPYSVLEAVSCDCKLILSDIKAHHALGFDALYFDQQLDEAEIIEKVWDLQGNINRLMENHNIEKWKESLNQII
jgi:glycosyltransferase involved in cell wall biosynthesis